MNRDKGFAALWVAMCLFFLMGAAALAVDVSGFYETARADQTTADLACLAGIPSMPENATTARAAAAENAAANFPAMAGATAATVGNVTTLDDGNGNQVVIEAPYGGDNNKMRVAVTETDPTTFGRVLGVEQVPVSQEAFCKVFAGTGGDVPFGGLPGGWTGGLQEQNPCGESSGNCGRLLVPRADTTGAGPTTIKNIAEGLDRNLDPGLSAQVNCSSVGAGGTCNIVETSPGVTANHLGEGFLQRLDDPAADALTFTFDDNPYDGDPLTAVLGGSPSPLSSRPAGWEDWIHGDWNDPATHANHYYWNDVIAKCDSPRLVSFPIVSADLDWSQAKYDAGEPFPEWPSGTSQPMRVLALHNAILADPNSADDFQGSGQLKKASTYIMWFGPNARCVGPNGSTTAFTTGDIKTWRLVNPGA